MGSINKSFLYGIGFASITWAVSLYLYWQLTSIKPPLTTTLANRTKSLSNIYNFTKNAKYRYDTYKNNVNSDMVIAKLQPILRNVSAGTIIQH